MSLLPPNLRTIPRCHRLGHDDITAPHDVDRAPPTLDIALTVAPRTV
jgi:hypothetical protein